LIFSKWHKSNREKWHGLTEKGGTIRPKSLAQIKPLYPDLIGSDPWVFKWTPLFQLMIGTTINPIVDFHHLAIYHVFHQKNPGIYLRD